MDLKTAVIEIAQSIGFQRVVIGGLKPMTAECAEFESWLARDFAASMEYLKRNPNFRTSPQLLYPDARSAIIVSASYYTEVPPDPGLQYGRVARYAVGLDYHDVLTVKLNQLKERLEKQIGRPLIGRAFTDDVQLYEQAFAANYGLGFAGKNTLIIGPKLMGSYNFVAELFTDCELEADEPYIGTCGKCFRCGDICPTDAIVEPGTVDANLCISFLTIENKDGIPIELRSKMGDWVFGCDLCQEVCPYNQRPPITPWKEFYPQSGVGHHLDLIELLNVKTEAEFRQRFAGTPLTRPKRKGLIRNALVVLGNRKPDGGIEQIANFASTESNPMLREHAAWALSQYEDKAAQVALEKMDNIESDHQVKAKIRDYLQRQNS